jgi:hypothetical protein
VVLGESCPSQLCQRWEALQCTVSLPIHPHPPVHAYAVLLSKHTSEATQHVSRHPLMRADAPQWAALHLSPSATHPTRDSPLQHETLLTWTLDLGLDTDMCCSHPRMMRIALFSCLATMGFGAAEYPQPISGFVTKRVSTSQLPPLMRKEDAQRVPGYISHSYGQGGKHWLMRGTSSCWVSDEFRFIYVRLGKTGSSTLTQGYMEELHAATHGGERRFQVDCPRIPRYKWVHYWVWATVRNPWDRALSQFLDCFQRNLDADDDQVSSTQLPAPLGKGLESRHLGVRVRVRVRVSLG